jgi:DNA (cytosine-5)-methyltransferase 1
MKHRSTELTFADLFCGAGGSTLGAMRAGAIPRFALNHWPRAVETYNRNHANGPAKLADISLSNPRHYPATDILIASPECTFHSPARGDKKPSAQLDLYGDGPGTSEEGQRSRATMWDVPRFAETHDYELIVVENVVEAKTKWPTFEAWLHAMDQLGYFHRELYLNSMFFGVPQSRDRLYVVFWKKGNRKPDLEFHPVAPCWGCGEWVAAIQSWKRPDRPYGKYRAQYLYCCPKCSKEVRPFAPPAAIAIDWSLKGERIGDRKKALATATMARIQAGIDKYWRRPGVIDLTYAAHKEARTVDDPLFTQTARQTLALYLPFLARMRGTDESQIAASAHSIIEAMGTLTAGGRHEALIEGPEPFYVKQFSARENLGQMSHLVGTPLGTITNVDHHSLVTPPFQVKAAGSTYDPGEYKRIRDVAEPMWTQTGTTETALISREAFIAAYYSGSNILRHVLEQIPTVTATDRHALIEGPDIAIDDCHFRMFEPHEIGLGMAFPDSYVVTGNKREKVRQYGGAVTPPVEDAIMARCIASLDEAKAAA